MSIQTPFVDLHIQPITPNYYDLLNDNDDNANNTPGTTVEDVFIDNGGVVDEVVPNATTADANNE